MEEKVRRFSKPGTYGNPKGKTKGYPKLTSRGGKADWGVSDGHDSAEMSLIDFERGRLEKKKILNAVKSEERKVLDNQFQGMKIVGKKKEEELSKKNESLGKVKKTRKLRPLKEFLEKVENEKSDDGESKRATQVTLHHQSWVSAVLGGVQQQQRDKK
ncbi:hypothetical protein MKW98_028312 [Papaver atlanticum]|uniref:Uncharacterized protein n=1 Tax=Papaver atlanticum TaxID=357466 RepID=A0AAD4SW61_9MAGN|nr:hypothetical protein MKW98_028312 [Papaver atlanticum]